MFTERKLQQSDIINNIISINIYLFNRVWDYPVKEQFGQILMAIDAASPVKNSSEGFTKVNKETNDFAFIHDSAEIRYEISRNCNLTAVGDIIAEQPYAIAGK